MREVYKLENGKIVRKYVVAVMDTFDGNGYFYLVDSPDSPVNLTRPTLTPHDVLFESPQGIIDKLMEEWAEFREQEVRDNTEHPNQGKFDFDSPDGIIPSEHTYPQNVGLDPTKQMGQSR